MPCVNRCWHCFCEGSPGGGFLAEEKCIWILDRLAELKEQTGLIVFPMFYDEPTLHPRFKQIMIHQLKLGLIYDEWWFSTNGYGLARMSDTNWEELAEAGFNAIRLTFHGIGEDHDRQVGREGAYQDLTRVIAKAEQYGVEWLGGMMLNAENQSMYERTRDAIERLGTPCSKFGWMLPQSQGRALEAGNRPSKDDISRLISGRQGWFAEGEFVGKVLSDPELGNRTAKHLACGIVYLDLNEDLDVFYGGGCDGDPFSIIKEQVYLGSMKEDGIATAYQRYLDDPPAPARLLHEASWAELARRYGDPDDSQVFHYTDLVGRKWAEAYLKDCLDV